MVLSNDFISFNLSAPVIGISGAYINSKSVQAMMDRVRQAGAMPLILTNHATRDAGKDIEKLDAAIIMGNDFDADPHDYIDRYPQGDPRRSVHPETRNVLSAPESTARAAYEKTLIDNVLAAKMPLFCICGGMHQLNIRKGGTLHQHIPDLIGHSRYGRNDGQEASSPVCPVTIVPHSTLARIAAEQLLYAPGIPPIIPSSGTVNSFHHQAVDIVGKELVASAFSDSYTAVDGSEARLVEAIEADPRGQYKDQFVLGVQWHPEFLPDAPSTDKIIRDVAMEAQKFAQENDRRHSKEEIERENILSALPFIRAMSDRPHSLTDIAKSTTPAGRPPSGRSR